ncbi:MAG TPA: neutral/alkaline non-lysosomal ceramidase N-terminal domain-containing protein [Verrucomicrobiae bacterium]|nr:neutral/alkaline non-lysosomal ceramidase N-terminal domain-containing protein [Verrucomicrobiae bacterium]
MRVKRSVRPPAFAGCIPRFPRGFGRLVLGCIAWLTTLSVAEPGHAQNLRAGLSKIDITPTEPVKMGGYESRKDFSQGIHDPLGARALVLANEGRHLAFVSLDNLGFYNDTAEPLRRAILDACDIKPEELFLCAIHTHSAPILNLDAEKGGAPNARYTKQLQNKLVEAVRAALTHLEPVRAAVCFGSSPVGVNRRELVQDSATNSRIVLGRNPSKITDREVQVLKLFGSERENLTGALFVYQTHSTSLGPKNYLISGDIHGLAEQFLEKYYGGPVVTPGFAGPSGNIDPWVRVLPDFRTNNGWIPEPALMGTMLGEEVARVLEGPQTILTNTHIRALLKTVALPGKPSMASPTLTNSTSQWNITAAALGDIAFVGWGGEVFNEIGVAVKKGSPFRHTFILTHCNGAAGYLPTTESYPEGGYEVQSSRFGPGAAEALVDQTLDLLHHLHDSIE